jgi:hypothetical protein
MDKPETPEGLGEAGLQLWDEVVNVYELFPAELSLLAAACRTVDELAMIERAMAHAPVVVVGSTGQPKVSGLFAEARAHRLVLGKLLEQLALPEPGEEVGKTPAQERASKAAQVRWALQKERRGAV